MQWISELEQELRSYLQVMGAGPVANGVLGHYNRAEIHVGREDWEKVTLTRDIWSNVQSVYPKMVFRFEHVLVMSSEMISWLRVWGEKVFYTAKGEEQIRLSTIVSVLLTYLRDVQNRVEVAVSDVNHRYITILVRERNSSSGETLVMTIPMQPSR